MTQLNKNKVHEGFEITENLRGERLKLLREERYFPGRQPCYLEIGDRQCPVMNFSNFGVAIRCPVDFECENELYGVPFVFDDVEVGVMHLRLARREAEGNEADILAFEIIDEPINLDKIEGISTAQRVISLHEDYVEAASQIPREVKAQVYEIADWLEHIMAEVDEIEKDNKISSHQSIVDYEKTIISVLARYLGGVFPAVYNRFNTVIQQHPDDIRKQSIDFLRQKLNHLIYQAPFADRVFNKPLGYAGDYEMMNLIYKQENVGKSLFARCLHRYYIDEPAAQAVRNRADYLIGVITKALNQAQHDRPYRILSVACGPAMEWQKLLPQLSGLSGEVIVDLLDQDEQALLSTQNHLRHLKIKHPVAVEFQFIRKAIKNIIARGMDFKEYDLIYSAGLFDYLSDPVALMAANQLFKSLRPGGKLVIGNFNISNPSRGVMEYALDWELIHRSEQDLLNLFKDTGGRQTIEKETLDINLFCVITKAETNAPG